MSDKSVLQGIRILDFSWVLAGPYATRLLADFGAEVIKVQPLLSGEAETEFDRAYYNTWNRNKRGITLNLNKAEGVALAKKLVAVSDAVVENFSPRVMANFGLDYGNLSKLKPDIIMLSMSLMGQAGPCRDYTGFGPTIHALSGMTGLTSFPDMPPVGPGFALADHAAALYASLALLGALESRRKTGAGKHIDLSQVEAMTALLGDAVADFFKHGVDVKPAGNRSPEAAPHNVYPCRGDDRWCAIAVFNEAAWQGLQRAMGNPPWTEDRKFASMRGRLRHRDELDSLIAGWTRQHSAVEVMTRLQGEGVAAGVVNDAADLSRDPHLKARGFFRETEPAGKTVPDAVPVEMSATPAEYLRAAPPPGRDNDYVYRRLLGMSGTEVAQLRKNGVI